VLRLLIPAAILLTSLALPVRAGGGPDAWTLQSLQRAAELFHLDFQEFYAVAECESDHFDPAVIYGPRTGKLGEKSLFQYLGGADHFLWRNSPWADFSVWDPQAAAFVTGYSWWRDPSTKWQWSCWRRLGLAQ
jgi:hypothetical protein